MTLAQKQALEVLVESGTQVCTVAYDPSMVIGTPEADAVAAGWTQYQRQDSATLVEVVYTQ